MVDVSTIINKIFGSSSDRKIKAFQSNVNAINELEPEIKQLSDDQLRSRTEDFKQQIANGATLDSLVVPAFATVREAANRTLGQRHFDVQLIGGMVLHEGKISEMRTGEGKTLVATLPVYLNALSGNGVHVVTVNDYLANRDSDWMGQIYRFLGLETGVIVHGLDDNQRREAYGADVTYGTNNEFGFDYLRDNMKFDLTSMVQNGHNFAIVDEVDSILIDEARTPLIISGPLDDRSDFYNTIDAYIPKLEEEDFELDEKTRSATFTELGNEKLEKLLSDSDLLKSDSLYDLENVTLVHHLQQALKAHKLFLRDRDYIVRNGGVVIIDEFTGRMMPGRRFSEGQHQALEAKEKVQIQPENQTLASITFQNYFRMYEKLAGMTGTALTEAEEFQDIYGLEVIEIPTNKPITRIDDDDEVYRTTEEKFNEILKLIDDCNSRGQPILVGTTSIEKSEFLAELMKKHGFKQVDLESPNAFKALYNPGSKNSNKRNFAVLNARYHEQEAIIIAQAGVPGAVTIATNMAGRGTDIQLGGNPDMRISLEIDESLEEDQRKKKEEIIFKEVEELRQRAIDAGGLYVVATERHESRRIDNQLRGRSGRQGDPGHSKFFLSLQDDLMRIFGSERMDGMLQKLGLEEGEAIVHPWINRALEKAQKKVEARNFDIRKNLLKFDNVMNDQRNVVFEQRIELMEGQDLSETIADMRNEVVDDMVAKHIPEKSYPEQWDAENLENQVKETLNLTLPVVDWTKEDGIADQEIKIRLKAEADKLAESKASTFGPELTPQIEKGILLQTLDNLWREHLATLDHLRSVVGFRGYGQRDPLQEYKTEAFTLFESMLSSLRHAVTAQMLRVELVRKEEEEFRSPTDEDLPPMEAHHVNPLTGEDELAVTHAQNKATYGRALGGVKNMPVKSDPNDPTSWGKIGRNTPCPCGSGKKYKHCHGKL